MKIQRASIVRATILSSAFLLSSCSTPEINHSEPTTPQGATPTEGLEAPKSSDKKEPRQKCGVHIRCMVA